MKIKFTLIFLILSSVGIGQVKNEEIIYNALLENLYKLVNKGEEQGISNINVILKGEAEVLQNKLFSELHKEYNVKIFNSDLPDIISFALEKIKINYSAPFREKIFSDLVTQREIQLRGSSLIKKEGEIFFKKEYDKSIIDTILFDAIEKVENNVLPFTQGEKSEETSSSVLIESVIGVATTVITVVLFFIIRSK